MGAYEDPKPRGLARKSAASRALRQGHLNSLFWSQRDRGVRLHALARYEFEPEPLGHRGQDEASLRHREASAYALSASPAERKVRETWQFLLVRCGPAIRVEPLWVVMVARVVVYYPLAHQRCAASGHPVAADLAFPEGLSSHHPGRWIEAHRFLDDALHVG
jgi:hypothetical protein